MRRPREASRVKVAALLVACLGPCWVRAGETAAGQAELLETLRSATDWHKRYQAAAFLRSHTTSEAMAALTDAAERDADYRVQKEALASMREMAIKKADLIGERQIKLLETILDDLDGLIEVREEAIATYLHVRGKAAAAKFASVFEKEKSPHIRFRLIFRGDSFWDTLKESPEAFCKAAVEDPEGRVAEQAANALIAIGDDKAIAALDAYMKRVPEKACGILGALARRRKIAHDALQQALEPRLKEYPLGALNAIEAASDPRHEAVRPILADLALKVMPLLPPGEKHRAFSLIGSTGSLRHLAVLNDGDNPARLRELYGPIAEDTLGRFSDGKANGMHSIIRRNLPRNVRGFVPDKKDTQARTEFVANFQLLWTRYHREEELSKVLAALTPEELEQAISPFASRLASDDISELLGPLLKSRPADGGRLLTRMFERFFEAGGRGSIKFRYALSYLAATERPEAAELLFRQWQKARTAETKDAVWEDLLFNALLAFRTPAAEDATLKLLDIGDRRRYVVIGQLGRIGTRKSHKELSAILAREPNTELRGGDIVQRTHDIIRRALAEIEKRRVEKGAPQPK